VRIGLGIDTHAFAPEVEGRALIIGGVAIEHPRGLAGHSDADVLVHAIMDALLGAARLGDIGKHFPPTDASYKDACSLELLKQVADLLTSDGWRIVDIDSVIIAQQPRLSPYREEMSCNIEQALKLRSGQVGIKATTTEYLGFEGREEGISAHAVVLLDRAFSFGMLGM